MPFCIQKLSSPYLIHVGPSIWIIFVTLAIFVKRLAKFRFSRPGTNVFRGIFVFLHQNSKSKEIMPEICHFYGIVITMYLPDHNPPHFHVRYNEFRATIDIKTGNVTGQMPRRALNLVFEWLDQHKDELMANWERMENGEPLVKINPLD